MQQSSEPSREEGIYERIRPEGGTKSHLFEEWRGECSRQREQQVLGPSCGEVCLVFLWGN